ncbi:hypothetical protein F2Q69_00015944 [Brassica cretica]|uniref:Uncharacterized protein n=1 Tax=Brassica cretica TaxID=69181 RepID=A0A8S9R8N6_BRACR|nr:hypothetical protein F2Q69_00015944 [Brassica cretica]
MSSRKGSSKRNSSSHSSSGDSSANEVIAPKDEFEVEEEAKDVYYKALCGSPLPSQDIPIPNRPVRSPNAPLTPSMVSPDYVTTLRDFYQIPSGVVFRIPSGNESAKNPPEGFFTCYEAFLVYCRMWFSILSSCRGLGCSIRRSMEVSGSRAELHSWALVRAERRGKRAIVAEMKRRAALSATKFVSFKDAQEFVGDFRECRGSVATLYKSQNEDFSFPAEVAEMSVLMNGCAHAESLVIEGRVRQLWDSLEVLEDTVEAGTGVGDEGAGVADGEVDQPASSFGVSMSGFFDFEL